MMVTCNVMSLLTTGNVMEFLVHQCDEFSIKVVDFISIILLDD